jgi:hypothetical protein
MLEQYSFLLSIVYTVTIRLLYVNREEKANSLDNFKATILLYFDIYSRLYLKCLYLLFDRMEN